MTALLERLRALRRRRVQRIELWRAFDATHPHLFGNPSAQATLRAMLDDLASAGAITTPKGTAAWRDAQDPPIPQWIALVQIDPKPERAPPTTRAWHPKLEPLAHTLRLSETERRLLEGAQEAFARWGDDEPIITVRERSLQLLGDDKALERLASGRLFAPGRLTLDDLRCRVVALPFVVRDFGPSARPDRDGVLILENKDTWQSACDARAATPSAVRWVAFGSGVAIVSTIGFACTFSPRPHRIDYFGDLDADGLRIVVALAARAAQLGLPRPQCVDSLYRAVIARADDDCEGTYVDKDASAVLVSVLPESLQADVSDLLARRGRLPQEWLTAADLAVWMARERQV